MLSGGGRISGKWVIPILMGRELGKMGSGKCLLSGNRRSFRGDTPLPYPNRGGSCLHANSRVEALLLLRFFNTAQGLAMRTLGPIYMENTVFVTSLHFLN